MSIIGWARRQAQRIAGVSTPWGGVQLRQLPDTSFDRAQDERELMDEIWLLAGTEAYGAKDGTRRLQEMQGQTRLEVIDAYFAANPEIKRWVDRNIEAGTCARAVAELRERKRRFLETQQERHGNPPAKSASVDASTVLCDLGISSSLLDALSGQDTSLDRLIAAAAGDTCGKPSPSPDLKEILRHLGDGNEAGQTK